MGSLTVCILYGGIPFGWGRSGVCVVGLRASMVPNSTVLLFRIRRFLRDSLGFLFLEPLAPTDEFG